MCALVWCLCADRDVDADSCDGCTEAELLARASCEDRMVVECPRCEGRGQLEDWRIWHCDLCHGTGSVETAIKADPSTLPSA